MCCFISLPCFEVKPARDAGEKDQGGAAAETIQPTGCLKRNKTGKEALAGCHPIPARAGHL